MNDEDFEKLVEEALLNVPKHFLDLLENVSVVTQNWPNRHQAEQIYKRGSRGLLLGLYLTILRYESKLEVLQISLEVKIERAQDAVSDLEDTIQDRVLTKIKEK